MHPFKLKTGKIIHICVICTILSCTADKITANDLDLYSNIDLALVDQNDWKMSDNILYLINEHRAQIGETLLIKDTLYATACAIKHSEYMIAMNQVNHDYFYSRSNELKRHGAINVSENIASGYTTAQSTVNAWLQSESHRKTIEGDFSFIGFGIIKSPQTNRYYYTTLLYK
jgi:uncharacterized protein YkwD